ncbi:MAG: mandelate racemase/muconate lactonizing enzyme family protein [Geminicoccaceae bacterium]
MRIVDVEAFAIRSPPLPDDPRHRNVATAAGSFSQALETCLVRVESEDGVVGWGEGMAPVAPTVTATILNDLVGPLVLGRNPFELRAIWHGLYVSMRERGHTTSFYIDALAALDGALHDLAGKVLGVPAYQLLGGRFRTEIPLYAAGFGGDTPEPVAATAKALADQGYSALKLHLRVGNDQVVRIVEAVRDAVGHKTKIMVDVHSWRSVFEAMALGRELEKRGVTWLEAPTAPDDLEGQAELTKHLDLAIATGEWWRTGYEWREAIRARAFDIAMPDVARAGLGETKRIADLYETSNLPVSPHVGVGGLVAQAMAIQLSAALPNLYLLEHSPLHQPVKQAVSPSFPEPSDGFFEVPDGPGLSIDVDEAAVREMTIGGST